MEGHELVGAVRDERLHDAVTVRLDRRAQLRHQLGIALDPDDVLDPAGRVDGRLLADVGAEVQDAVRAQVVGADQGVECQQHGGEVRPAPSMAPPR